MQFTSEQHLDGGLLERHFTLGDIPGILWTPQQADRPSPLVLMGPPGALGQAYPRLLGRARRTVAQGFAAATLEPPGAGDRPPLTAVDEARAELQEAIRAGRPVSPQLVDRLVLPLVDQAVPEAQGLLDDLLTLPEIGEAVAISGGNISIGVRLARIEPRLVAASLFAGSLVPSTILEEAREVTIPVHVLLQWDDEFNPRQDSLDLFDALGSTEKTLQANLGGHTGVPEHAGEDAARFLARHLGPFD